LSQNRFQRKARNNSTSRVTFFCMTHQGDDSKPIAAAGDCPFLVRAYCRTREGADPFWEIVHSETRHTCAHLANRNASRKRKNPGLSEAAVTSITPSTLVRDLQYGKRAHLVHSHLASQGLSASKGVVTRCATIATREQPKPLSNEEWRALAAYINEFVQIDARNQGRFEATSDGQFHRGILVPGSAIDLVANGFLSSVVTADFSHVAATTSESDAIAAIDNAAGSDEGLPAATAARPRGRPRTTTAGLGRITAGLGRIAILVGRSYIKTTVLLAVAIVPSETLEQAEWFFAEAEQHLHMTERWGRINMFLDRGHAINAAANNVFGDKVFVAHCFPHFKRNIIASLAKRQISVQDKNVILAQLGFAAYSSTEAEFTVCMGKIAAINRGAHDDILAHEPQRWSQAYLPFNTFGNITSNDAEGRFGTVCQVKNGGSVLTTLRSLLEGESRLLSSLHSRLAGARRAPGTLAVPELQTEFQQLCDAARFFLVITRPSDETMVVQRSIKGNDQYTVDLRGSNRRSWCSCGRSAHSVVPCEHVIFAVERAYGELADGDLRRFVCQQATHSVVVGLLTGASMLMTPTNTAVEASMESFAHITRPAWVTVSLAVAQVPESARTNIAGRELGRRRAPTGTGAFLHGPSNSRIPSTGESELTQLRLQSQEQADHARVRVQLGRFPTAPNSAGPVSGLQDSGDARPQRKCRFCKAPGHYQKACPLKKAAAASHLQE
jgi:hypothetical protein